MSKVIFKDGQRTDGVVVADHIPGVHPVHHGALRAILDSAPNLGGVLPDQLSVVTPALEQRHVRGVLAVALLREVVNLAVVPHISSCHLDRTALAKVLSAAGESPHRNVLAVVLVALLPARNIRPCSSKWRRGYLHVMLKNTFSSAGASIAGNSTVPRNLGDRVVGTVKVVVVNSQTLEVIVGGGRVIGLILRCLLGS